MTKCLASSVFFCGLACAAEPVISSWILTPPALAGKSASAPEVHSVAVEASSIVVRSSGVSLTYLGPLQASPQPGEGPRVFEFRIPREPHAAEGAHTHVGPQIVGVFRNGVPIYNQFEAISYQGQNIWHFDPIALGRQGEAPAGLIESLMTAAGRHSPILGFALDGYPVYGPWGFGGDGALRRMRSSYRLRKITERNTWPDGTRLTPAQYGPAVSARFPLGTFAEDYEYSPGFGDLDQYNGRFARTPEYPQGTYAYFLATDAGGKIAFPYLLASEFYGEPVREPRDPATLTGTHGGVALRTGRLMAGRATNLHLDMPARFLEYVHEKPIHMMIVSADLADFAHIHPELTASGDWEVPYTFPHAGRYRVYIEFAPPGQNQRLEFFDVAVPGSPPPAKPLTAGPSPRNNAGVTLETPYLQAGRDIELRFLIRNPELLQPYLGAWAHFTLVGQNLSAFIHAHPMGAVPETAAHTHGAGSAPIGPAPSELRTIVSFPQAGLYKLWAQFQVSGQVEVVPFLLRVDAAPTPLKRVTMETPPPGAIHISVTASGYEPARVEVPKNEPVYLWFTRTGEPNCGSQIVIPALNLKRDLPLGGSILVTLPPRPAGELRFNCGMNMFRGMIVVH